MIEGWLGSSLNHEVVASNVAVEAPSREKRNHGTAVIYLLTRRISRDGYLALHR